MHVERLARFKTLRSTIRCSIGTGFSSKVPCYKPSSVLDNVRRFLDGKPFVAMDPWFRGFAGTITDAGDGKYNVEGAFTKRGEDFIITEIPVGGRSFLAQAAFLNSEKSPVRLLEVCTMYACLHDSSSSKSKSVPSRNRTARRRRRRG